jgi:histidinol-phosphate aminotransferase
VKSLFLDRNENQYGPAPQCYEVLAQAQLAQVSLYSRMYARGKKSELSDRLSRDIGIPEERVLLSYGSEDMLKQVVHCYLHREETILLPRQSWWYYKSVAGEVFGTPVEYSVRERDDRFVYDVDEMTSFYDRTRPQVILIASPNNPTGNGMRPSDLTTLIRHCSNAVIVLDEAYGGFSGVPDDHCKDLLEHHERLVILRTFSKYYALAGLRIGYACVGSDLKHLVSFSARYLGYNQLTEKIALAALDAPDYYHRVAEHIREDSEAYYALFAAIPGFKPFRTEANFILVRFPVAIKRALQAGLEARGVIVKFLDDPGLDDCVRITIGTRDQNAQVMGAFREIVSSLGILPGQPSTDPKGG